MNNLKYWLTLEQTPNIGIAHLKTLYEKLQDKNLEIIDVFDLSEKEIEQDLHLPKTFCKSIVEAQSNLNRIEEIYLDLLNKSISIIPFFSNLYPKRLHEKLGNNAPPFLYIIGNKDLLKTKGAAILGDSKISNKGEQIAFMSTIELAKNNITAISGFAKGADTTVHRAAVEHGGNTIAILPCGIDHLKIPNSIKEIFNPDHFLIISPFFPTKEANKFNGYIRNRITCAISYSVFVVEAPIENGIFEAAKSAFKLKIPLYTTEYANYPKEAEGNPKIISELNGIPIRGRMENNLLIPNIDKIIADVKFN